MVLGEDDATLLQRRSMRILTWNVNGLRTALRKGCETHLERPDADACTIQEMRVLPEQPPDAWNPPPG